MEKRAHNRTKSTQRDYYGYISVEKPRAKKDKIEENQDEDEIYKQASNFDKTRNGTIMLNFDKINYLWCYALNFL